jgi:hypothetical protein
MTLERTATAQSSKDKAEATEYRDGRWRVILCRLCSSSGTCTCHSSINSFWAANEGLLSRAFPSSVSSRRLLFCWVPPILWWYRIAELTIGMWGILPGCRFTFHCCPPYWRLIGFHAKQDSVQNLWLPLMTNATHWFINSGIKVIQVWLKSPFLNQGAVHFSVMLTDSWACGEHSTYLSHTKPCTLSSMLYSQKVSVSHLWPQPKAWVPGIGDKCVHSCISSPSLSSHSNWREPTSTIQMLTWSFVLRKWPSSGCFYNWMGKWLLARQCQVCAEQV